MSCFGKDIIWYKGSKNDIFIVTRTVRANYDSQHDNHMKRGNSCTYILDNDNWINFQPKGERVCLRIHEEPVCARSCNCKVQQKETG